MLLTIVPSFILLAGVVDDLRSRKVHNWLVGVLVVVAMAFQLFTQGWAGVQQGALGIGAAMVVGVPLVIFKLMGAGDMKLMLAFGMATSWKTTVAVMVLAIVWGALLGLIRAVVAGEFKKLMLSTYNVALKKAAPSSQLHKIPYTVALFFGWLTHLVLARLPGGTL